MVALAWSVLLLLLALVGSAAAQDSSADARARATEQQMTDDERFSLVYSLMPVVVTGQGGRTSRPPRYWTWP